MEKDPQIRYSDEQLLQMLQNLIFDHGKAPSQRLILSNKDLPTHHTYRARFGSVADATALITTNKIGDNTAQHVVLGSMLVRLGAEIIEERPRVAGLLMNYSFTYSGKIYLVDMLGVDGTVDILQHNAEYREKLVNAAISDSKEKYIQIMEAMDIITELEG